ncbi:MAG: hypothetical protein QME61_02140 [Patescibacteria group bacterium]|nr:hypothetical protein [Patescibacteria group bacterium]
MVEKESGKLMPEREKFSEEILREWYSEKGVLEKRELTEEEKEEKERLKAEIEKEKLPYEAKIEIEKEAEIIKRKTAQGKIKHLLDLAQAQGLAYAVGVAKKMDDPYLLDLFHDILAKEGLYKKFLEK